MKTQEPFLDRLMTRATILPGVVQVERPTLVATTIVPMELHLIAYVGPMAVTTIPTPVTPPVRERQRVSVLGQMVDRAREIAGRNRAGLQQQETVGRVGVILPQVVCVIRNILVT